MEKKNEWLDLVKTALPKDKLISECIPKEFEQLKAVAMESERRKEIEVLKNLLAEIERLRDVRHCDALCPKCGDDHERELVRTLKRYLNSRIASSEAK